MKQLACIKEGVVRDIHYQRVGEREREMEVLESSMVTPNEETPNHRLWVSNLDLVASRAHTPTVYFYKSNGDLNNFFSIETLKLALSQALVLYYPLAGRLGSDSNGRPEINCNGEGALFVVAQSDYTLDNFKDLQPSAETKKLFIPSVESGDPPLLLIQVTFLKCGGVALGIGIHHITVDGRCAFHFIQTWTSIARGDTKDIPSPFHDRTLLRARSPLIIPFDHPEYTSSTVFHSGNCTPFITSILKLSQDQINTLKIQCGSGSTGARVSSFRAVAAHIWKCMCISRGLAPEIESRVLFPVEIRGRMHPPLPQHYFGNALIRVSARAKVSEILSNSIGLGAEKIKGAIDRVNDEYARSVIDHLEMNDTGSMTMRAGVHDSDLWIMSWLGMPIYDADFGWGNPQFMSRAETRSSGYAYLTDNRGKNGGISVLIALEVKIMECFRSIFYEEL